MKRAQLATGAMLVISLGALAACGGGKSTPTAAASSGSIAGQTITLYSGQHEQTTDAMVAAFEKQTGVKVKIRADDEDVLASDIEQEGSHSPADVFYTENTPPLVRLDEKGMLSPIESSTLANVPSADNASTGDWVGVSARVSVLVYNPSKISAAALPKSVLDLADPQYKGKIGIAPGETDFQPIITSIADDKGDAAALAWLKAVKANAGSNDQVADNETLVADVNSGTLDLAIINHYYWYRLRAEIGASKIHSQLAYFAPHDDGYLLNVSGAAVLKSSTHQAAAQALVNFLTSKAGESVLAAGESFEYPLGSGAAANSQLTPLSSLEPKKFSLAQVGDGTGAVTLLQEAGLA